MIFYLIIIELKKNGSRQSVGKKYEIAVIV